MKTCLVTGASGGIGGEIAKALSRQGYNVLLQGRNTEKLTKLQQQIHHHCEVLPGDLNLSTDRNAILQRLADLPEIDLIVNAAGTSHFSAFDTMDESHIAELITTNLISPMLFIQAFVQMKNQENSQSAITIANIGSAFGYIGYPGFAVYSASKFGLRGFTESMRREYADTRFTFTYFAPRATHTNINSIQVDNLNKALGNHVDSPEFVAQQFMQALRKHKREATVGWPEKLFVKMNSVLPAVVDNAIKSKLATIRQFMNA